MLENQDIIKNIKDFISYKKLTVSDFEFQCGIKSGLISAASKNNGAIGSDKISKILEKFTDLNANWLLRGTGEMLLSEKNEGTNIKQVNHGNGNAQHVSIGECEKELAHLRELLAEKERTIQILLNK